MEICKGMPRDPFDKANYLLKMRLQITYLILIPTMNHSRIFLFALLLASITFGCGAKAEPTKEQLISDLNTVYDLLSGGDYEAAADYFKGPKGMPKAKLANELKGLLEKRELSKEGIEILDSKGTFGPLREVFPDRAESWMGRNDLPQDAECYAIGYQGAEVAAHWTDDRFEFIRMDDVGKLR